MSTLSCSTEALRQCGLSARKAEYLAELARHFDSGEIHTHRWPSMSDAEIIGERWQPWRSVVTWHLWRSLDPLTVEY